MRLNGQTVQTYSDLLNDNNGKCTVHQIAATVRISTTRISVASASKVIRVYKEGVISLKPRGHGRRGVGSLIFSGK